MYRIFLLFFCTVVVFVIGACASGPPVILSEKDVSPVMIDASIIISIKEPFISILLDSVENDKYFSSIMNGRGELIAGNTEEIIISSNPQKNIATIAFIPSDVYPSELIGWELNHSNFDINQGPWGKIYHFWSNAEEGFGISVFPNLIFVFFVEPSSWWTINNSSIKKDPTLSEEILDVLQIIHEGQGIDIHPEALKFSNSDLFGYVQDIKPLLEDLDPLIKQLALRMPINKMWAATNIVDNNAIADGIIIFDNEDSQSFIFLIKLILMGMLSEFQTLGSEVLQSINISDSGNKIIRVTNFQSSKEFFNDLLILTLRGLYGSE